MVSLDLKLDIAVDNESDAMNLIHALKNVTGAQSYDGDASIQVLLPLVGGGFIRIGITDVDLTDNIPIIWADRYQGLPIVGNTNLQTGKQF